MCKTKTVILRGMQEVDDYRVDIVERDDERGTVGILTVLKKAKEQAEAHNAIVRSRGLTTGVKEYTSKE